MSLHSDRFNRGGHSDPIRKEPISLLDQSQTKGYMAMYGMSLPVAGLPDNFPSTAIFLLGHELGCTGLLRLGEEAADKLIQPKAQTWHLRHSVKAQRMLYALRAMAGWYD